MPSTILLGDCHTHLDQYPSAEMPEILDRARESGVAFAVCAGTTVQSTKDCRSEEHTSELQSRRNLVCRLLLEKKKKKKIQKILEILNDRA